MKKNSKFVARTYYFCLNFCLQSLKNCYLIDEKPINFSKMSYNSQPTHGWLTHALDFLKIFQLNSRFDSTHGRLTAPTHDKLNLCPTLLSSRPLPMRILHYTFFGFHHCAVYFYAIFSSSSLFSLSVHKFFLYLPTDGSSSLPLLPRCFFSLL